ncbi:sortase [Raoultibacter phocaeensis]|uniref:sortase n=1 Tax=Raoultibacter phocaeensis TaxID=2479841 RepID=UPI001118036F|nr:sortase [Raoultibacter phocaeensis]
MSRVGTSAGWGEGSGAYQADSSVGFAREGRRTDERSSRRRQPARDPKKRSSGALGNLLSILIFLLGVGISLYPYVAQEINSVSATKLVAAFNEAVENMPAGEGDEAVAPGVAYGAPDDDMFGSIFIPKIELELPIYVGSTDDNLEKGVAHLEGTSLPVGGASTHTVLAGHSYTVTNEWFTRIERLEAGDLFYIRNSTGVLTYRVVSKKIIQPTDTSDLLIERDKDLATLLTCTASGNERVIVRGERVEDGQ